MRTPHRGRRRACALAAVLLAAACVSALAPHAAAQQNNNDPNGKLVGAIDDVVSALGNAVDQGNKKEVREIDRALKDLIRALEDGGKQKHHKKHHHGQGSAFGRGMDSFTGAGDQSGQSGDQQGTQSGNHGGNQGGSQSGNRGKGGSFGRGVQSAGNGGSGSGSGQTGKHRGKGGSFGSGLQAAAGAGTTTPITSASAAPVKQPTGRFTKNTASAGVNNGVNQVTTNISNLFNGPANVNINNGQQTVNAAAKTKAPPTGAAVTAGANKHTHASTKAPGNPQATAKAAGKAAGTTTGTTTTAAATKSSPPPTTVTGKVSGAQLTRITDATAGQSSAVAKTGASTKATQTATNTANHGATKQMSQVGKLPGGGKQATSHFVSTGSQNTAGRHVGSAVGSRPAHTASVGKKR